MAVIPKLPFPNVPKLPGVPQLPRPGNFPSSPPLIVQLGASALQIFRAFDTRPVWGIFKNSDAAPNITTDADGVQTVTVTPATTTPVVVPDSLIEMDYKNEWNVPNYPIQQGGFLNYNKVNNSFEISLRMTKGGSVSDRQAFLDSIEAIDGDLKLYEIRTPEKTYRNCNVIRFEYSRIGTKGAFFLAVDLVFKEIRITQAEYSTTAAATLNARDPSAVPPDNLGTTQPIPPSVSVEGVPAP